MVSGVRVVSFVVVAFVAHVVVVAFVAHFVLVVVVVVALVLVVVLVVVVDAVVVGQLHPFVFASHQLYLSGLLKNFGDLSCSPLVQSSPSPSCIFRILRGPRSRVCLRWSVLVLMVLLVLLELLVVVIALVLVALVVVNLAQLELVMLMVLMRVLMVAVVFVELCRRGGSALSVTRSDGVFLCMIGMRTCVCTDVF